MSADEDPLAWLRAQIEARAALARHTLELGNGAEWTEPASGVLMTCWPDDPDPELDGLHPLGDLSLSRLIAANDPQDTIARCEAELAILDRCWPLLPLDESDLDEDYHDGRDDWERWRDEALAELADDILALLLSGYRHRPGYREEWAPKPGLAPLEAGQSKSRSGASAGS